MKFDPAGRDGARTQKHREKYCKYGTNQKYKRLNAKSEITEWRYSDYDTSNIGN